MNQYKPLQVDVPEGWEDKSTIVMAPPSKEGKTPTASMVVKRRPLGKEPATSLNSYLQFMGRAFGELSDCMSRKMRINGCDAYAVKFSARAQGKKFKQTSVVYVSGQHEVSATVTQLENDSLTEAQVEAMLQSVRIESTNAISW